MRCPSLSAQPYDKEDMQVGEYVFTMFHRKPDSEMLSNKERCLKIYLKINKREPSFQFKNISIPTVFKALLCFHSFNFASIANKQGRNNRSELLKWQPHLIFTRNYYKMTAVLVKEVKLAMQVERQCSIGVLAVGIGLLLFNRDGRMFFFAVGEEMLWTVPS